jgi:DNA-binding NarL/FixJ family response regulator
MCLRVLSSDHRSEMNRIVIVDDHPAFRAWARAVLAADGFQVAGEAADAANALTEVRSARSATRR